MDAIYRIIEFLFISFCKGVVAAVFCFFLASLVYVCVRHPTVAVLLTITLLLGMLINHIFPDDY